MGRFEEPDCCLRGSVEFARKPTDEEIVGVVMVGHISRRKSEK